MGVVARAFFVVTLLTAPPLLCLVPTRTTCCAAAPADTPSPTTEAHQFYLRVLGEWVGTAVSRLSGAEPTLAYFHLVVSRMDANTFREEYTFYRIHPQTGVLAPSGTQSVLSAIGADAVIRQTCRGSGTVLIDMEPKKESFEATGEARMTSPELLQAEAQGKIAVDGLPLNLGKNGKLRKATASWSLQDDKLSGETLVETSFRSFLLVKRFRMETQLRAERGSDVRTLAGRMPAP
jgi:hypothetical protein